MPLPQSYSSMSCRTGLGGSLYPMISTQTALRAPIESHKLTCDVQKPACELPPTLYCPAVRPSPAQGDCGCCARRGGHGSTSPNEQAAYKCVARPKHFGGVSTGIVDTRASGEGQVLY